MISRLRIITALALCASIFISGAAGYMLLENYSFLEGLYMSAITISTVGFGEIRPLSDTGRIFTALLILFGFIGLAFAGHAIGESLLVRVWSGKAEIKKMKKKISALKDHFIICGFGRVGFAAADHFAKAGVDFVIIETSSDHLQNSSEAGCLFIEDDATRDKVLMDAGIKKAKGLLALVGSDPENLFISLTARELNPTLTIISRANDASSSNKILRAGADRVISPFVSAGNQVANDMLAATGKAGSMDAPPVFHDLGAKWITVKEGSSMIGFSIKAVAEQMERKVIGLRRDDQDQILPDTDQTLEKGDKILIIDALKEKEYMDESYPPEPDKIVIVDDNPVIVKLYTRLFQKAGFNPITAFDGKEGLDAIMAEKPVAAVIDYMLPVLSGIQVCQQIRQSHSYDKTKLILFTADDKAETRKRAIRAGADEVVVKSPEAREVIETVIHILNQEKI